MTFAQPFQDYEILDRVGAGAMGTVFKARHKRLSRIVALKVLRPSLARDTRYVDRLRREARIVAALNHPNIVTGYDLGEESGYHFFVMEFIEGKSLRGLLTERGVFEEARVLDVAMQVATALDHAFQRGVIHRDVKPGNILIDEAGNVKLTDMGLAKGPADLTLTRDGSTVGTPQYISPEQARNPHDVDVRSDLYSLGATLYHMATGQPPFPGDSMAEVITKVLHEMPLSPRLVNPALSDGLSLVIRKLLAKNLKLRYQTPRQLLDDLARVRDHKPPQVDEHRLLLGDGASPPRVWLWSLAAVAGAAVVGAAFWLGTQVRIAEPTTVAPDEFLAALDRELAALPALTDRLDRLRRAEDQEQSGTRQGVELRRRAVIAELQQAVDRAAADLQGDHWPATVGWLRDATRWPSLADFEMQWVSGVLLQRTGLLPERLPNAIDRASIDRLLAAARAVVNERDRELHERAVQFVEVTLPARADERRRSGDFAAAAKVWEDALRQLPMGDRLDPAVRAQLQVRLDQLGKAGMVQIDAAEANWAKALFDEATAGVAALRQLSAADADPGLLLPAAARLRHDLQQAYPAAGRFRPLADKWTLVEDALSSLERELALRAEAWQQRRIQMRVDLAWAALQGGDVRAAMAVLGDAAQDPPPQAALLAEHRRALAATERVATAVLRALQRALPPIPGQPRDGGPTVGLRIVPNGATVTLEAQPAGGNWRPASITEFRFADLWKQAVDAHPELLAAIPADERALGRDVLGLVGDELASAPTAALPGFLRDDVWPRLVRMRREPAGSVGAATAFARLRQAWQRAREGGDLSELTRALANWTDQRAGSASTAEVAEATAARKWRDGEQGRLDWLARLRLDAPPGAVVDVVAAENGGLRATVDLPAAVLQPLAERGWTRGNKGLEYAAESHPFAEVQQRKLDIEGGLPLSATRVTCDLDVELPAAELGPRLYLLDFRGVVFVLVVGGDEGLSLAIVDGDPRQEAAVQAAWHRAYLSVLPADAKADPSDRSARARVVAGAVHRLRFEIQSTAGRTHAVARVLFDPPDGEGEAGASWSEQVILDPVRRPSLVLYPLRNLIVHRAAMTASGF